MTHFILQQNINENDLNDLIECITETHNTYETFYHIPFDTSYPKILKAKKYLTNGKGGVTFSGGEPLLQTQFLISVCKRLKKENIHIQI